MFDGNMRSVDENAKMRVSANKKVKDVLKNKQRGRNEAKIAEY